MHEVTPALDDGPILGQARVPVLPGDTAEALAIGRRIGDRVLVIATSTGGTLAALAATDPELSERLAGVVLISPNFGVQNPKAGLLTLPVDERLQRLAQLLIDAVDPCVESRVEVAEATGHA